MSMDVIADFCTSIRNALAVKKRFVVVPHSSYKERISEVMKTTKFLKDYLVVAVDGNKKELKLFLNYVNGVSVLSEIKSISKASCRVYKKASEIGRIKNGLGVAILSTNRGVMTNIQAKNYILNGEKISLGGEVICEIW